MCRKLFLPIILVMIIFGGTITVLAQQPPPPVEEEMLNFMRDNLPQRYRRMNELRQHKPQRFSQELEREMPRFRQLRLAQGAEPEEYQWQIKIFRQEDECRDLKEAYQQADAALKPQKKEALRENLSMLFDLKYEHQRQRMKTIERKLAELKENLEKRAQNRQKLIEKRLEQLLDETENLDW